MADISEPVGEVLRGLLIDPLPHSWTALDAVCMVKCLNEDGRPMWSYRATDGINDEELLGALVMAIELLKSDMLRSWEDEPDT
jgi:hypothetical protein